MYQDVIELLDDVRVMVHRAVVAVERVHAGSTVTVPMRAVLEFLRRRGPRTVADIARERSVTRQHIQAIVNELLEVDFVERIDNPRHRRSPLIALTGAGARAIDAMQARERTVFEPLLAGEDALAPDALVAARSVIGAMSEAFGAVAAAETVGVTAHREEAS